MRGFVGAKYLVTDSAAVGQTRGRHGSAAAWRSHSVPRYSVVESSVISRSLSVGSTISSDQRACSVHVRADCIDGRLDEHRTHVGRMQDFRRLSSGDARTFSRSTYDSVTKTFPRTGYSRSQVAAAPRGGVDRKQYRRGLARRHERNSRVSSTSASSRLRRSTTNSSLRETTAFSRIMLGSHCRRRSCR